MQKNARENTKNMFSRAFFDNRKPRVVIPRLTADYYLVSLSSLL